MADGGYQRTCAKCQHAWVVPTAIAEERPDLKSIGGQMASLIGGNFADQVALKAHFQQLGAAAKCPQCGATSFTQVKEADVPDAAAAPEQPDAAESGAAPGPAAPSSGPGFAAPTQAPSQPTAVPGASAPAVGAGQPQIYVINQKLVSLTGDLWIEDGQGNHMFEVDGSLFSLRGTHVLKDLNGQELYEVSTPLTPHMHKTINISRSGQTVATVQEAIFHLGGDKFTVSAGGGLTLSVHGDWMNREFQVKDQAGVVVIDASRAWFSIHDAYGVQITPGFEVPLGLAIVIALERVEAQEQGQQSPIQNLLGGVGPF
jgi:uncharacterized protein YxjI